MDICQIATGLRLVNAYTGDIIGFVGQSGLARDRICTTNSRLMANSGIRYVCITGCQTDQCVQKNSSGSHFKYNDRLSMLSGNHLASWTDTHTDAQCEYGL